MRWDPAQYSRFAAERDRPFFDLTSRIDALARATWSTSAVARAI